MLSDEVIDKVIERLIRRIEKVNTYTLKQIAKTIKKMGTLAPSDTQKLIQVLNYGGDYEKILKEIAKMTKINEKEIYEIFDEVAKSDYQFARQYYKYRNAKYIPYEFNKQLKDQVQAIASITAEEYKNISRTLAFSRKGADGKVIYSEIGQTYQDIIDEGVISLQQGKDTFNQQMTKIVKELSKSGLRTIDWESGISRRLEYATRMHLQAGIRNLHNEMQQQIADEIGADGVEISVHNNPAPDHQDAQGRQFRLEQFNQLQETGIAKDYKGRKIDLHRHLKNGDSATSHRPISQYNCYHYTFSIILGVNKPQYTNEQLEEINKRNLKGFEYGGKHYTMYEGTQLQRKIENAIRKEKDTQIMAKESGQDDLVQKSEKNINALLNEYIKVSKESGLPTKMERLKVEGYKQVPVVEDTPKPKTEKKVSNGTEVFISKEENERLVNIWLEYYKEEKERPFGHLRAFEEERYDRLLEQKKQGFKDETIKLDSIEDCNKLLDKVNTEIIGEEIKNTDFRLVQEATESLYKNTKKSPSLLKDLRMNKAFLKAEENTRGVANTQMNTITLNNQDFKSYDKFKEMCVRNTKDIGEQNWWCSVAEGNETKEVITHEFGHRLQRQISWTIPGYETTEGKNMKAFNYFFKKYGVERYSSYFKENMREISINELNNIERDLIYEPIRRLQEKEGLTQKEIIKKYVSDYGKSSYKEMFAEVFANSQLGKSNALGDELIKFLIEIGEWEE